MTFVRLSMGFGLAVLGACADASSSDPVNASVWGDAQSKLVAAESGVTLSHSWQACNYP